jgi:hypothetical protein
MGLTIGESISRIRNVMKGVNEDAFLTDRLIYSIVTKYAKLSIRKQQVLNKILSFQSLFVPLPCVDLIEVDRVEACCNDIKSNCTIMRTKDKLPTVLEGDYGAIFRTVSSIDGSQLCYRTQPATYVAMTKSTNFKYNNVKYYWYLNGYLYLPNVTWEAVRVEGLWEESIEYLLCDGDVCAPIQDNKLQYPEYLFAEVEQNALKELGMMVQMPAEGQDDKQSQLRT